MAKFMIEHKGKMYIRNAANALEAAEKYGNRMVFGEPAIFNLHLEQYDAETRGEKWAIFTCNGGETVKITGVELSECK